MVRTQKQISGLGTVNLGGGHTFDIFADSSDWQQNITRIFPTLGNRAPKPTTLRSGPAQTPGHWLSLVLEFYVISDRSELPKLQLYFIFIFF